jgi:pimeloyl-ACP methyl ester carboxylesterase
LKALKADVLLLGGTKSQAFLKAAMDALASRLPQAKRVQLAGVGHMAADDTGKPERVAVELRKFFSE